ncbi:MULTISPECIES: hypothetical protein [unclassified Caballeronia]|nr:MULTISPECIES: hypothetical protein [unclassified Caballeronia]
MSPRRKQRKAYSCRPAVAALFKYRRHEKWPLRGDVILTIPDGADDFAAL